MSKKKLRGPEIIIYQKVGVDEETYFILREQKQRQRKSMVRIVKELIKKEYGN